MTTPTEDLADLLEALHVDVDVDLLSQAVTHRSFAYEEGGLPHNERLEFLGDSVLGIVVTEFIYLQYPDMPEGQLAKLRAAVVNARALADVARALGVGECLRLGRGELITGGREKASILADAMEAVIGAVYLSAGSAAASALIHRLFDPLIMQAADLGAGLDWKTSLQEAAAHLDLGVPVYEVEWTGPDHAKEFTARVHMSAQQTPDEILGAGQGRSKKVAEQEAAQMAYETLQQRGLLT
jgi:ribonuclease-3